MPTVDLSLSNANAAASEKLSAFDQFSSKVAVGQKNQFSQIPAFYIGGGIKEHFAYKRDADGNKIPKKSKGSSSSKGYTEYEREESSDGFIFSLRTPDREALYVVTKEKPSLEIGSFYLVSGLGYGHGSYPTFLDEKIKLEKAGQLTLLPSYDVVLKED